LLLPSDCSVLIYLVRRADSNKQAGLLVPHEHYALLQLHHHVEAHLAHLDWELFATAFDQSVLLVTQLELVCLGESRIKV